MSRIENPNLEKFIKSFVVYTLEKCDIFRKVYKKGFAQKKLEDNVKHVFSNEYSATLLGYQTPQESSITICTQNKDDPILQPEDLYEDSERLGTILHESIHAILTKDKQYCKKHNIVSGSGMYEAYKIGERGRGINEGLTNWICYKAGYCNNTYIELTCLMFELELAIGKEKVMRLGKGDLKRNIPQLLGMNRLECKAFVDETDTIYFNNDSLSHLRVSILNLEKNENNEDRIFYLKEKERELARETEEVIKDTESRIFEKYFSREWKEIFRKQQIKDEAFIKFKALSEFMHKGNELGSENSEYPSERFLNQFKSIEKIYFEKLINDCSRYYSTGKLTVRQARNLIKQAVSIGDSEKSYMIEKIAETIAKNDTSAAQKLIEYLVNKKELNDISQYSIYYAKTEKSNIQLYFKNNKIEFTSNSIFRKSMRARDEVKEPNRIFDFTLALNENSQNIIREFLQIKQRVEKQNPDANINILDRTIEIDYGNKKKIYFIEDGMILPLEIENGEPIQVKFQPERKEFLPVEYRKQSIWNRVIQKVRDSILKNPNGEILYNDDYSDKAEKFRKTMVVYRKDENKEKDGEKTVYRRKLNEKSR